jgi:hypothetical protein
MAASVLACHIHSNIEQIALGMGADKVDICWYEEEGWPTLLCYDARLMEHEGIQCSGLSCLHRICGTFVLRLLVHPRQDKYEQGLHQLGG